LARNERSERGHIGGWRAALVAVCSALGLTASGCYAWLQPLPAGVSYAGIERPAGEVTFLADLTYVDPDGVRRVDQNIFDEVFSIIARAESVIVVDMFLYNDFQGETPETTRALSAELTEALVARKRERPGIEIIVISDPVNNIYGGIKSKQFQVLRATGIEVVVTRLDKLRDSNPLYSGPWRLTAGWFGAARRPGLLPSPFNDERVTLRSYLSLLNFKANHRKVVLADDGDDGYVALVTSANPHDASSAHGNVALRFSGAAVADLWETERAVIAFSDAKISPPNIAAQEETSDVTVQVITEGKIRAALFRALARTKRGDEIDVAVFYLSDRGVIEALGRAHERGAQVRVLLDPNKDAFGYKKGGIPNRPVGGILHRRGIAVRWWDTHGEQCHAKMLLVRYANEEAALLLGSANFTRRNLRDYNLETSVMVRGRVDTPSIRDASQYFALVWANDEQHRFSVAYDAYKDESRLKAVRYKIIEESGLGTF